MNSHLIHAENWEKLIAVEDFKLCGVVPPELQSLKDKLDKIPVALPRESQVQMLFEILKESCNRKSIPIAGGCDSSFVWPAISPEKLGELAKGNEKAISLMGELAKNIVPTEDSRGLSNIARWYYSLAQLKGVSTSQGKRYLQKASAMFSDYYSQRAGGQSDSIYLEVLKLVDKKQDLEEILASPGCTGEEYSIVRGKLSSRETEHIRTILDVVSRECQPLIPCFSQEDLKHFKALANDSAVEKWLGPQAHMLILHVVQEIEIALHEGDDNAINSGKTKVFYSRGSLLKWLAKRFPAIKKRKKDIEDGCY